MTRDITFDCNGLKLRGTLHMPEAARPPCVVGCHGLFSDRRSPKQIALAERCCRLGLAYLRIDHRGCGDSQGDFAEVTSLEARCRDLAAAVVWMRGQADVALRFGLFGSSMGGAVCLASAAGIGAASLVTAAAPIRSKILDQAVHARLPESNEAKFFDTDKRAFDLANELAQVGNILMFHGAEDEVVPIAQAHEIYRRVNPPKRLVVQEDGDHRMSRPDHQRSFLQQTGDWLHAALTDTASPLR